MENVSKRVFIRRKHSKGPPGYTGSSSAEPMQEKEQLTSAGWHGDLRLPRVQLNVKKRVGFYR